MHMGLEGMTKNVQETSALLDQKWVVRCSHCHKTKPAVNKCHGF